MTTREALGNGRVRFTSVYASVADAYKVGGFFHFPLMAAPSKFHRKYYMPVALIKTCDIACFQTEAASLLDDGLRN